jgi:hypothetical protein
MVFNATFNNISVKSGRSQEMQKWLLLLAFCIVKVILKETPPYTNHQALNYIGLPVSLVLYNKNNP